MSLVYYFLGHSVYAFDSDVVVLYTDNYCYVYHAVSRRHMPKGPRAGDVNDILCICIQILNLCETIVIISRTTALRPR